MVATPKAIANKPVVATIVHFLPNRSEKKPKKILPTALITPMILKAALA